MKFQIIRDMPRRLRLRAGAYSFSDELGLAIEETLEKEDFIIKARSNGENGSLCIEYVPGTREKVFESLRKLNLNNLKEISSGDRYNQYALNKKFEKDFIKLILRRYAVKLFVPRPIRRILSWTKAAKYFDAGIEKLLQGKCTIEVLDASAIGASLFQGHFETASSIMFFLSISELLERYTTERAKLELSESLSLHVDKVWKIFPDGEKKLVPLENIEPGDVVSVQMGNTIPVDGCVVNGIATVDEATMTGESLPAPKQIGSTVFAGTVIADGDLNIKVTGIASDTRIHKIVEMIDTAEGLKASIQSEAERMADKIVPYSFLTALAIYVLGGNINKALAVLMVDYSCALKLSTPISVLTALREAAQHRVMIKGGRYLEEFAAADTIVFDKTGTLTKACPTVTDVVAFRPYSRKSLLRDAACIEEHFPHSVAKAIVHQAEIEGIIHEERHTEVQYIVAHGIKTTLEGQEVNIGSHHFIFEDEKVTASPKQLETIKAYEENHSMIYMSVDGKLAGFICINDPPRDEAKEALENLRGNGFREIQIITGDGERAARTIAQELSVERYHHQVLPDGKVDIIKEIKKDHAHLVMVGDGINDSPALAEASVSVAMKDASDIAREVADIVVLESDLNRLNYIRDLSQSVMKRIQSNFQWIVGINTALIGLGAFGIFAPTTTALLHNSSTFLISIRSAKKYH